MERDPRDLDADLLRENMQFALGSKAARNLYGVTLCTSSSREASY